MHSEIADSKNNSTVAGGIRGRSNYKLSAGLVFSVTLHALALSAVIFSLYAAANPNDIPIVVPIDIVQLDNETAGPLEPKKSDVPQQQNAPASSPAAKPVEILPAKQQPPPDDLEIKLRKLAKLQQPIVDVQLSAKGEGLSRISAMNPDAALKSDAAIKDFLRDQIEHHWHPDLSTLHGRNISVMIRVRITNAGAITNAEIVNGPGIGIDPVYDDIASSARAAVLLSSPLTLPPGRYAPSMEMILSLNTKDALR